MRGVSHCAGYERHRRKHIICDRRGSDRRALRLKEAGMERVKAVIFDWAGTVIDYGSLAPMGAFVETFAEFGVSISIDEARGPMGMAKRPHIVAIVTLPRVVEAWTKRHGHAPTEADIDAVYAAFVPKNLAVAARYAHLIPGAAEVVAELRSKGIKIGSSTREGGRRN